MFNKINSLIGLFVLLLFQANGQQVRVRVFADQRPSSAVISVIGGQYELDVFDGKPLKIQEGDPILIVNYRNKIAVKTRHEKGFACDSLVVKNLTDDCSFMLRLNNDIQGPRNYSGALTVHSDLGVLVFINTCDVEEYIAGVVRTEGGPGRNIEYLKSQSVLARTFLYKHFNRHVIDGYNLCDGVHCQAFKGITNDQAVRGAANDTRGLVALDPDSILIISAFHSNCGGETTTADNVWLSAHSHVTRVIDPYCRNSLNATWKKTMTVKEWESYLEKSGFKPPPNTTVSYNFKQETRQNDYKTGSFSIPFNRIRNDLNLKSAFFSVLQDGNTIILNGRGYGHGVGLCQEGAMVMASKGFKFRDIIGFYYPGTIVTDIRYAKIVKNDF